MRTLTAAVLFALTLQAQESPNEYFDLVRQARAKNEAKEWSEAAKLWQRVVALNPVRSSLWNALAEAHFEAKEYRPAIAAWEKALELGWWPAHSALHVARAYARLGDEQNALRPPKKTMSRVEGWTRDLRLIRREIERKGFSPYRRLSSEQFDARVAALEKKLGRLSDVEVIVELSRLLREVDDGHTGLIFAGRPEFQSALPVQFYQFAEGTFIIAADPAQRELLGAQVLQMGRRPIDDAGAALEPLMPRDNPHGVIERIPFLMRYPALMKALGFEATELTLRFPDGTTRTITLKADTTAPDIWKGIPANWIRLADTLPPPVPLYLKNRTSPYWFEYLPDEKLLFFQWNSVRSAREEPFDAFVQRLMQFIENNTVEKFVVDMRWNNGGNTIVGKTFVDALRPNAKVNVRDKLFLIIGGAPIRRRRTRPRGSSGTRTRSSSASKADRVRTSSERKTS
jgi:hypothetical protein